MKMIELIIDSREHCILDLLNKNDNNKEPYLVIRKELLNVGDFIVQEETGNQLIIERKTWQDLQSSIKDNRYREQRSRMKSLKSTSSTTSVKAIYLIEGRYDPQRFEICQKALYRLQIDHGIPVVYSISPIQTIYLLKHFCKDFERFFSTSDDINIEKDQVEARTKQLGKKKILMTLRYFSSRP